MTLKEMRKDLQEFKDSRAQETDPQEIAFLDEQIAKVENLIREAEAKEGNQKEPAAKKATNKVAKEKAEDCDPARLKALEKEVERLRKEKGASASRRKGKVSQAKKIIAKRTDKKATGDGTTASAGKQKTATKKATGDGTTASAGKKKTTTKKATGDGATASAGKKKTTTKKATGDSATASAGKKKTATKKATGDGATASAGKKKTATKKATGDGATASAGKKKATSAPTEAQIARAAKLQQVSEDVAKDYLGYRTIVDIVQKFHKKWGEVTGYTWVHNTYKSIADANQAKRFTSTTPAFPVMQLIHGHLQEALNNPDFTKSDKIVLGDGLSAEDKKVVADIVEADKDFLTANFVKRFVAICKSKNKKAADALVKSIETAEKKKAIQQMPYYKDVREVLRKAKTYDFTVNVTLKGIESEMNGLQGVLNGLGCTCERPKKKRH